MHVYMKSSNVQFNNRLTGGVGEGILETVGVLVGAFVVGSSPLGPLTVGIDVVGGYVDGDGEGTVDNDGELLGNEEGWLDIEGVLLGIELGFVDTEGTFVG